MCIHTLFCKYTLNHRFLICVWYKQWVLPYCESYSCYSWIHVILFCFYFVLPFWFWASQLWLVDLFFFLCFHCFSFFFLRKNRKSERPAGTAAISIYRHVLYVLSYLSPSSDLSWDFLLSSFSPFWAPRLALFLPSFIHFIHRVCVWKIAFFLFWFIQNVLYNFRIKYLPWVCK